MARAAKCLAGVRVTDICRVHCCAATALHYLPGDLSQIRAGVCDLRFSRTSTPPSPPPPVAPHPLLRGLAEPGLELALHRGCDPFDVVGLIGRARNFELLQLDLETALLTH